MTHKFTKRAFSRFLASSALALAGCGSVLFNVATAQVDSEPLRVTLGGASAGGFHTLLGEAIAQMVRSEYPGSSIGYEPGTQAGQLVRGTRDEIKLTLQTTVELQLALEGHKVFPRQFRLEEIPIIAKIIDHQDILLLISQAAASKYGIHSFDDIRKKKPPISLSFYPRGNLFARGLVFEGLFKAYDITEENVKKWGGKVYYVGSADAQRLYQDRKIDFWLSAAFHPDSKTIEVNRAIPLQPLRMSPKIVDQVAERFGLKTRFLKGGTYSFIPDDYYTPSVPTYLVSSPKMSDIDAYKIAKSLYNQFDKLRGAHPSFSDLEKSMLVQYDQFYLHPGAERFYREVGLLPSPRRHVTDIIH